MRKLFIFLCLFSFFTSQGQNKFGQQATETKGHKFIVKTSFGFKGGYNKSIINAREPNGTKSGYIGGELYGSFFADTRLSKRMSFENELLVSWTDNYHFIEIPLHLKYWFADKWKVFAGPKVDILVDPSDAFNHFNHLGISVEGGLQYTIWRRFFAESRYSYGLSKLVDDFGFNFYDGKRNTFRVGLGINF